MILYLIQIRSVQSSLIGLACHDCRLNWFTIKLNLFQQGTRLLAWARRLDTAESKFNFIFIILSECWNKSAI